MEEQQRLLLEIANFRKRVVPHSARAATKYCYEYEFINSNEVRAAASVSYTHLTLPTKRIV